MLPKALAGKPAPGFVHGAFAELINPKTGCFKRELTVSLRTADPQLAKRRDFREAVRVAELIAGVESALAQGPDARESTPATLNISELEALVLSELLQRDEEERRGDDRRRLQTQEERSQWPDLVPLAGAKAQHMEEDHFLAYGDALEDLERDYRLALARRDPRIVEPELRAKLKELGLPGEPEAQWYREAGLAVLRAHAKAYGLKLQRQRGDDVPTPELPQRQRGPKLSEAYALWKAGSPARGSKKPSERTLLEASYAVRRFTELHGDLPLGEITREQARAFRDALARTPTRLPNRLRRLPLPKLLAAKEAVGLPPPHASTVNKAVTLLAAVISSTEREGHTDKLAGFSNPFGKGLRLAIDDREGDGREPFSAADLTAIFSTAIYRQGQRPKGGGGEAAFWLPAIALLSGARQAELAQLRLMDLAQDPESGVWHFDIGRNVKTATSVRKVPVHPELIRMGLLRYRGTMAKGGTDQQAPLWPHVESDGSGRQAGPWSKWFNRHLRTKAGVTDRRKVFHSFRHSFKRMARDAGLSEEMHDALTGHAGGGVGRTYGSGFGLKALVDAIAKVDAPEVVKGLTWDERRPSRLDVAAGVEQPEG